MKVTTERLPKSLIALDIELDQQQVEKGLDRAARKLSQQFRIPGFRPGKAPRFIVENYVGRARLMEEASDDLINKSFQDALKQEQITPVGKASLENVEEKPFRFRVTVPVEPSVELPDYRAYQIPYEVEPVSEETVQKLLDAQREQHAVLRELEEPRPAQEGDMLTVTMESDLDEEEEADDEDDDDDVDAEPVAEAAFVDEVDYEDDVELDTNEKASETALAGEADHEDEAELDAGEEDEDTDEEGEEDAPEESQLALVEGQVRPEIYQALLGAAPGETRTVTVHYGEDDENENLRGRDVTYTIEVKNVQERLLPEWDELPTLTEFEGDLEAFRANARSRLEHAAEERARQQLLDAFVERMVAETPLEIPDAMIEERAAELLHERVAQFARYGLTEEQYLSAIGKSHEEAVAEFREQAEQDVRRSLILREIIRREGLELTPEDATAELDRFLDDYAPERREEIRPLLQTPQMATAMASSALDRKLRDRLVAIATGQTPATAEENISASESESDQTTTPVADESTSSAPVAAVVDAHEQSEPEVVGAGEADQVADVSTVQEGT